MTRYRSITRSVLCLAVAGTLAAFASAQTRTNTRQSSRRIEGLTEPYRKVNLASSETGLIVDIAVKEGDAVTANQVVARLDDQVLRASLAIAEAQKDATGQLKTAQAELALRKSRHAKLTELLGRGHATQEEVELANSELIASVARVLSAEEARLVRELEHKRIIAQLKQRQIISPFDGVVVNVKREQFEFVSYTEPVVMTVVQLDPLLAVFTMSLDDARRYRRGQAVEVAFVGSETAVKGTVSFISPVLDAESQQVRMKVELPNKERRIRSGAQCSLIEGGPAAKIGSQKKTPRR